MGKKYRNKSIKTKLTIVFTILQVLMLSIAAIALSGSSAVSKLYQSAYSDYAKVAEQATQATSKVYQAAADIELVLIYTTDEQRLQKANDAVSNMADAITHLDEVRAALKEDNLIALYDTARASVEEFSDAFDTVLAPLFSGDLETTLALMSKFDIETTRNTIDNALEALNDELFELGEAEMQRATKRQYLNSNATIPIVLVAMAFALTMAISTIKNIRVPLQQLTKAANLIAEGEVEVEIVKHCDDEIGHLSESMMKMVENIKYQAKMAQEIAVGNLQIDVKTASERDVLNNTLKTLVDDNNEALSGMKEAALQVSSGAEQVASASQSLAQGSTEQASAIQQITASIDEIATRTKVNANDANEANQLVTGAKNGAVKGNERMSDMIQAMADINESSVNISKIMKVIDDIAFQTNILALNAAVEAARAGQHGKGFAVVAEEVRNLAGKSAQAASETAELIEDSIRKVGKGSKLAEETAEALNEIVKAIDQIVTLTGSIAVASNDQATAVTQIDQAISQVSQVVQTNSSTSEQCAAASEELSAQAVKLRDMLAHYKLKETGGYGRNYYGQAPEEKKKPEYSGYLETAAQPVISLDDGFGKY